MRFRKACMVLLLALTIVSGAAMKTTQAFSLGDLGGVVKAGGIAVLVNQFSGQLNSFINTLMAKNGVSSDYATKVVPVITVGNGTYAGAAQVTGPQELVDQTKAVLQLEGDFSGGAFRIKGLIPINTKSVTNFSRVQGVGVSAQIDVRI